MQYEWIVALHIISMVVWVSGLISNGILLGIIANTPSQATGPVVDRFRTWDKRITAPAEGLTWLFGITLIVMGGWMSDGWLHIKLLLVVVLSAVHGIQMVTLRKAANAEDVSSRLKLMKNSAWITLALVLLVIGLVELKPL